jgi:hypothetical protein
MALPEQPNPGAADHIPTEFLEQYCRGLIGEKESGQIRSHLNSCTECSDRLAAVARFLGLARGGKILGHFDDDLK